MLHFFKWVRQQSDDCKIPVENPAFRDHLLREHLNWAVFHNNQHILYNSVFGVGVSQAEALKEENDSLRCQLDAYRNEVELLKQEQGKNQPIRSEEDNTHSQQLSFLQQALQGMQKVILHTCQQI